MNRIPCTDRCTTGPPKVCSVRSGGLRPPFCCCRRMTARLDGHRCQKAKAAATRRQWVPSKGMVQKATATKVEKRRRPP